MTPVFITTTIGHSSAYKDQKAFRLTLSAFFNSMARQTVQPRLIIVCHDIPFRLTDATGVKWIYWKSVDPAGVTGGGMYTLVLGPNGDHYEVKNYDSPITDMGRKTVVGQRVAHDLAASEGIDRYWVLRMDSDDLLAREHVEFLSKLAGVEAVYNRRCHVFDHQTKEFAALIHPYSTTCNALLFQMMGGGTICPRWDYHYDDHTRFERRVREDNIPSLEVDNTLCILSNTGNNLSDRPGAKKEPFSRPALLTDELKYRYGLGRLL